MFHSSKETFRQHLRQFLENWIFDGKSTGADLTKYWKFCTISKWGKKIFFGNINCSSHQKQHFYNIWDTFWKIKFLTENRQARPLQNSENFVLSQNGVRKYFLAKLFGPLIKRNIATTFEAVFGKLNFWQKFDRRRPYKIVKILYYLKMGYENIFWQNYLFDSSKETFLQHLRQFLENWIFDRKSTGADLTK